MFEAFRPKEYVSSVFEIDYEELWDHGIRGLLFDIDNTLATYNVPDPSEATRTLIRELRDMGFSVWIISNGKKKRVTAFAEKLGVHAIWKARKPFPLGIGRIRRRTGLKGHQLAIIGDQLFTDIWAGNWGQIYTILVKPISEEDDEWVTKIKRGPERHLISALHLNLKTRIRNHREKKALMHVDGSTKLLAVIGHPIAHTLSPMIHQIFIDMRGDGFAYVPFHVLPENLEKAINGAWGLGIVGINVTIPHKQEVMAYTCDLDISARLAGAVNTLKWTPNGYRGYNTDIDGFRQLLRINRIPVNGQKVLIIGAGGAACSALTVCYLQGASEVVIYNRTKARAEQLIKDFSDRVSSLGRNLSMKMRVITEEDFAKEAFPVVLQTTSAGMSPNVDQLPDGVTEELYRSVQYAADMVFNPFETRFCRKVKAQGGHAVGGLSMLFFQGLRSYEIWTGRNFRDKDRRRMHARFMMLAKRRLGGE